MASVSSPRSGTVNSNGVLFSGVSSSQNAINNNSNINTANQSASTYTAASMYSSKLARLYQSNNNTGQSALTRKNKKGGKYHHNATTSKYFPTTTSSNNTNSSNNNNNKRNKSENSSDDDEEKHSHNNNNNNNSSSDSSSDDDDHHNNNNSSAPTASKNDGTFIIGSALSNLLSGRTISEDQQSLSSSKRLNNSKNNLTTNANQINGLMIANLDSSLKNYIYRGRSTRYESSVRLLKMERSILPSQLSNEPDNSRILQDIIRRQGGSQALMGMKTGIRHVKFYNNNGDNETDDDDDDDDDDDSKNNSNNNNNNQDDENSNNNNNNGDEIGSQNNEKNNNSKNGEHNNNNNESPHSDDERSRKNASPGGRSMKSSEHDDNNNKVISNSNTFALVPSPRNGDSKRNKNNASPMSDDGKFLPSILKGLKVDLTKQAEQAQLAQQRRMDSRKSLANDARYLLHGAIHSSHDVVRKYSALLTTQHHQPHQHNNNNHNSGIDGDSEGENNNNEEEDDDQIYDPLIPRLPDIENTRSHKSRGVVGQHHTKNTARSGRGSSGNNKQSLGKMKKSQQQVADDGSPPNTSRPLTATEMQKIEDENNTKKAVQYLFMTECRSPNMHPIAAVFGNGTTSNQNKQAHQNDNSNNNNSHTSSHQTTPQGFSLDPTQNQQNKQHFPTPSPPPPQQIVASNRRPTTSPPKNNNNPQKNQETSSPKDLDNTLSNHQNNNKLGNSTGNLFSSGSFFFINNNDDASTNGGAAGAGGAGAASPSPRTQQLALIPPGSNATIEELLTFDRSKNVDLHHQTYRAAATTARQPQLPQLAGQSIGSARKIRKFNDRVHDSSIEHGRYGIREFKRAWFAQQEFRGERKKVMNELLDDHRLQFMAPQAMLLQVRSRMKAAAASKDHRERLDYFFDHIRNVRPYIAELFPEEGYHAYSPSLRASNDTNNNNNHSQFPNNTNNDNESTTATAALVDENTKVDNNNNNNNLDQHNHQTKVKFVGGEEGNANETQSDYHDEDEKDYQKQLQHQQQKTESEERKKAEAAKLLESVLRTKTTTLSPLAELAHKFLDELQNAIVESDGLNHGLSQLDDIAFPNTSLNEGFNKNGINTSSSHTAAGAAAMNNSLVNLPTHNNSSIVIHASTNPNLSPLANNSIITLNNNNLSNVSSTRKTRGSSQIIQNKKDNSNNNNNNNNNTSRVGRNSPIVFAGASTTSSNLIAVILPTPPATSESLHLTTIQQQQQLQKQPSATTSSENTPSQQQQQQQHWILPPEPKRVFDNEHIHLESVVNLLALVAPLFGATQEEFGQWVVAKRRRHANRDKAVAVQVAKSAFTTGGGSDTIDAHFNLFIYNVKGVWKGVGGSSNRAKAYLRFTAEGKVVVSTTRAPLKNCSWGDDCVYNVALADHHSTILVQLVGEGESIISSGTFTVDSVGWKRLQPITVEMNGISNCVCRLGVEMDFPQVLSTAVRKRTTLEGTLPQPGVVAVQPKNKL